MGSKNDRRKNRTTILVTGASGFVGRHFINSLKEGCLVYALARRSQRAAGVEPHNNLAWFRGDLGKRENVVHITDAIADEGGVDYVFHFAGYYDFTNRDNREYQRTNVDGTRYLLENTAKLNIKRFIFSSSLTVTDFSDPDRVINEQSPLDATIPYARSKIAAEALIRGYSEQFPCTIVRLAAIFSDWCEYGPLYVLLRNWLSNSWKATLMPGRGDTAQPYLHVADLNRLMVQIIRKNSQLSRLDVLLASPDGCVSQKELFDIAVSYYFGHSLRLRSIPVWLAAIGVAAMGIIGRLLGNPPFARVWMLKYIDRRLQVDAAATRGILGWHPFARYHIARRMLFLIENMKANPDLWEQRNLAMANKAIEERPGLKIYEVMNEIKEEILERHIRHLTDPTFKGIYPHYHALAPETLRVRANLLCDMLEVVILTGDRRHILHYANYLARARSLEGISQNELRNVLCHVAEDLKTTLVNHPKLSRFQQRIHDDIGMSLQLLHDEIEGVYESMAESEAHPLNGSQV